MKYRHIVFDIDGTLIDTEYAVLHLLQETIRYQPLFYNNLSFISGCGIRSEYTRNIS